MMNRRDTRVSQGWKLLFLGSLAILLTACGSGSSDVATTPTVPGENGNSGNSGNNSGSPISGYLYTTTNSNPNNQVLRLTRHQDGSLSDEQAYSTNGVGSSNQGAGGSDVHNFTDSQGGIQIVGDYLLAVNAGDNTISVFSLDKANGDLSLVEGNVGSGGVRPVSIAAVAKADQADQYWVVVANQYDNPNVQMGGENEASVVFYPSPDFFSPLNHLIDAHDTDMYRNLVLFSLNNVTGQLTQVSELKRFNREFGGPTSVSFSDDGTRLAVSTWGIPHLNTATPLLKDPITNIKYQHRSSVHVYNFNGQSGALSQDRKYVEEGVSGTVGLSWAHHNDSILYATSFNLTADKRENSYGLNVLRDAVNVLHNEEHSAIVGNTEQDHGHWTAVNADGSRLYVSSFNANSISVFSLNEDGTVTKGEPSVYTRGGISPAGDSKDIYITDDNQYLYNLGAFRSFSISGFEITDAGLTYKNQYSFEESIDEQGNAGAYNFLGLTGFDLQL